ncbi:MAG TPA: haloacid dehalogenase type II [Gillisia sp.]|nr:haloacid dehalogenase type II [Gillisia sp.]
MKPGLLIFDVNETLLDMEPIKTSINESLNSNLASSIWFNKLLFYSLAETITENYLDFGKIGAATLRMTAQELSAEISDKKVEGILGQMTRLNPHPEVKEALQNLKTAGYKMVVLTNGGSKTVKKQLEHAGISQFFDEMYSVEAVKKFKPHPQTYAFVLEQENLEAGNAMLIAAHGWDIMGAGRAGLKTAFITRPGKFLYPSYDANYVADNLTGLAQQIAK